MVVSRVVSSQSSKPERHEGAVSRGITRVLVAAGDAILRCVIDELRHFRSNEHSRRKLKILRLRVQTVVVWDCGSAKSSKGRNIGIRDQVNILSSTGECDFALLYIGDTWMIVVRHKTQRCMGTDHDVRRAHLVIVYSINHFMAQWVHL